MLTTLPRRLRGLPTPMAGLALGVASLGWCMENALPLNGWGQLIGAFTASALLLLLVLRFVLHTETLWEDLKHPVVGSIVPTFAMSLMVISRALLHAFPTFAAGLWCVGITLHLAALIAFIWFRLRDPVLEKMVPSWFIPPVGFIVADVAFPGVPAFLPFAQTLFVIGLVSYAILLPTMLYRLFFLPQVANAAKPTLAILAAPASLSLAGLLSVYEHPHPILTALLFGIAVLMTIAIYFAFWNLLRLKFSPGYAAFTFPMAIGATALYKLSDLVSHYAGAQQYAYELRLFAHFELAIAAVVICYVFVLYMKNLPQFLRNN